MNEELEILPIKKEEDLELRMYNLVIYNISGIQAGIQSLHATVEYSNKILSKILSHLKEKIDYESKPEYVANVEHAEFYLKWSQKWKTVIIKNGGTSNNGVDGVYGFEPMKGSLNNYYDMLQERDIKVSPFYEPDLNNAMTAIAFLVDERVFNRTLYPNFRDYILGKYGKITTYTTNRVHTIEESYVDDYKYWCEVIGENNLWLRDNIQRIGLANN